jgi:hypothetical protein
MNQQVVEKQKAVVIAVARAMQSDWRRIVCSYEVEETESSRVQNTIVGFVHNESGILLNDSLPEVPNAIKTAFYELRAAMSQPKGQAWNSAEVVIEQDGNYKFSFSYDAPKRINGIFDEDSNGKFSRLAQTYKAERESA